MRAGLVVRFAVILVGLSLLGQNVCAIGLGFYGSGGSGTAKWEEDTDDNINDDEIDFDHDYIEAGFVMDTTVASDHIFNYRLTLGYRHTDIEIDDDRYNDLYDVDFDVDGVACGNAFGFGVVRTDTVRLWVGPALDFSYFYRDTDTDGPEMNGYGVGIGPIVGLNLNMGPVVTLAFSAGYRFSYYRVETEADDRWVAEDFDVTENMPYGNAALIFRIVDNYQPSVK